MQLGVGRRARLRGYEGPGSRRPRGGVSARTVLVVCAVLVTTEVALSQSNETLLADATAPLDENLRSGAMVFVEDADGHCRLLRVGDKGGFAGSRWCQVASPSATKGPPSSSS